MRKLVNVFRTCDRQKELRIFQSKNKFNGRVKCLKNGKIESNLDFFGKNVTIDFIKLRLGFVKSYQVPFERKNGKIILFPINKQKRIIWSNNDYDEWAEAMADEITDEEITPEYYSFCRSNDLEDERINLDIEVDGYIVAFANLGLWNGRVNGAKLVGYNVKDILYSNDDYVTWFCDPYNVRCDTIHHDGRNHILYRVASSKEQAERLVNKIAYEDMSEEEFRKATKSLRPYVAKVYGW
jgi:hypothetical protein